MPHLVRLLNPTGHRPAFLVPLFAEWRGGNNLLVQAINPDNTIRSFSEFSLNQNCLFPTQEAERIVGQPALWAFQFEDETIAQGSAEEIAASLQESLANESFSQWPWLRGEVANFCNNRPEYLSALKVEYKELRKYSFDGADVWRDAVVILPEVKKEILERAGLQDIRSRQNLDHVSVHGSDDVLKINLPPPLLNIMKGPESFTKVAEVANTLGLKSIQVRQKESQLPFQTEAPVAPYGVVFAQGGMGALFAKRGPSAPLKSTPIFPEGFNSAIRKDDFLAKQPLFAFSILRSDADHIQPAINFSERWSNATINIAIVVRPIGFGTPRKDKLNVFQLKILNDYFDYVFVVGNHILKKPPGVAPGLAASHRAIPFIRCCVNAWLELGTLTEFQSASIIRRTFSREGFCLLGRSRPRPEEYSFDEAAKRAFDGMLQENLPHRNASSLLLIGPEQPKNIRAQLERNFKFESTKIHTIWRRATKKSGDVACLSFGIKPVPSDPERFNNFCMDLIKMLGWEVQSELVASTRSFYATRSGNQNRKREILFSSLIHENRRMYPSQLISEIRAADNLSPVVLITNFRPGPNLVSLVAKQHGFVCHYSQIDLTI